MIIPVVDSLPEVQGQLPTTDESVPPAVKELTTPSGQRTASTTIIVKIMFNLVSSDDAWSWRTKQSIALGRAVGQMQELIGRPMGLASRGIQFICHPYPKRRNGEQVVANGWIASAEYLATELAYQSQRLDHDDDVEQKATGDEKEIGIHGFSRSPCQQPPGSLLLTAVVS